MVLKRHSTVHILFLSPSIALLCQLRGWARPSRVRGPSPGGPSPGPFDSDVFCRRKRPPDLVSRRNARAIRAATISSTLQHSPH